jgi:hypothetical protein
LAITLFIVNLEGNALWSGNKSTSTRKNVIRTGLKVSAPKACRLLSKVITTSVVFREQPNWLNPSENS